MQLINTVLAIYRIQLNEAELKGDYDMLLSEVYELLLNDYQEARAINDELMELEGI